MPRVMRFRIAAIDDLCRQLTYAPPARRRRQMDAAEQLVNEIDPALVYPADFVIYRITGYRRDQPDPGTGLVGEALLGDLVAMIQRISRGLELPAADAGRNPLRLEDAARRLGVSTKTLQRYRRQGLVCHYVVQAGGGKRLVCFEDALGRFADRHRGRVDRAAAFSRLDGEARVDVISEAREARARGLSLSAAARQIAGRRGRAHETVRMILLRHDRRSDDPIFSEHGVLTERDLRLIERAAGLGVKAAQLARRFGKTVPAIHRALNRARGRRLAGLHLPAGEAGDASIPSEPALESGLPEPVVSVDALALIESNSRRGRGAVPGPDAPPEAILLAAYRALRHRAGSAVAGLPAWPTSEALDAIETDLRWATLIKLRLVEIGLPPAIRAVEQFLGRGLAGQTTDQITAHVRRAIDTVSAAVDSAAANPLRRLAQACAYEMSRTLAAGAPPPAGRAAQRHETGSVIIQRPYEHLCPWQPSLDLRPDLRAQVHRLEPAQRRLVEARWGLGGQRPRTLADLARRFGGTPGSTARAVAAAQAQLGRLRSAGGG